MSSHLDNISNPVIRQIADNCTYRHTGDFGLTIVGGVKIEEFAQALIKECVKRILDDCNAQLNAGATINLGGITQAKKSIKNHFGVDV